MKEFAVAMIGLLVCLQQSTAQEKEKATESKFESIAAKNAVNKFQDRLALLDAKLMEQVELARGELKTDLEKALDLANEAKDFPEIQRIASYLESNADPGKRPETEPSKSTNVSSLQKQIRILQTELANAKMMDPIVGKWDYHNGNQCDFTEDGWVMLKGVPIGLWRRHKDGSYAVAFLNNFNGTSDQLQLRADGQACEFIGSKERFQIDRVKN